MFPLAIMEFHVSRAARDRYEFDLSLFQTTGNVILANLQAARVFAHKINAQRDLKAHPEQAVRAGQLNAMGLIDEIMHQLVAEYRRQRNPRAMSQALAHLEDRLGGAAVDQTLRVFCEQFPPVAVYRGEVTLDEYLAGSSQRADGTQATNREIALEEMLVLWLENENPAFSPFNELFDDARLERETAYFHVFPALHEFFDAQPKFGARRQNLLDVLLAPARAHPTSLTAQLEFLRGEWGELLASILVRLLGAMDVIREEDRPSFGGAGGPGGAGPALVAEFGGADYLYEPERFSRDLDWMPNLVLLAKNTYVWLDQLARKYHRTIIRLDQVPDEELEVLRRQGITGLWLIGLWERSPASQRIKQLRGNPNAVASAYSLFSYEIAADLGGEEAYQHLRDRAWQHNIRLASDMVPNHMGIDSRWVIEHPDWFVQLPYPPFPSYTFNGPNLSWDERVGLFIEDHYFDNTDAAVVFKRVDFWTGGTSYIYHGNDGTSIPWNDTAQLNYLIPEVREAVIQTILHVARKFPVIRFDAAMTLAKKHYQRLWFPEPGTGGAIASRAEHGLTKPQFDEVFTEEFWRMVVDRVAQEAPDTLLLAEAFWLMEGYFVRTLGMHRVYNSAFMNMLRDEKNQEYRLTIKNTLEFDPEILKRYVNFMNNPDERTAVDQFGKGDKYFGVCTMLATLPGLPMMGHGQVEGFGEKYGMEFRYPMWHEQPDEGLIARHQAEIFPLLRRRWLFAEARDFLLYDFYTPSGNVNEDVFAYSNRAGDQAGLVVYNNRYAEADGWINISAAYAVKTGHGDEKTLAQRSLGEGLGLRPEPGWYTIYSDHRSGLEFIRSSQELCQNGMHFSLGAYQYYVFLGFRQVQDDERGRYGRLMGDLQGRGVLSIDDALREMDLSPILAPFRELVNPGMFNWLIQNRLESEVYEPANFHMAMDEVARKARVFLVALQREVVTPAAVAAAAAAKENTPPIETQPEETVSDPQAEELAARVEPVEYLPASELGPGMVAPEDSEPGILTRSQQVRVEQLSVDMRNLAGAMLNLSMVERGEAKPKSEYRHAVEYLLSGLGGRLPLRRGDPGAWGVLLGSLVIAPLGRLAAGDGDYHAAHAVSRRWTDDLLLGKQVARTMADMGVDLDASQRNAALVALLAGQAAWPLADEETSAIAQSLLRGWIRDDATCRYLLVHDYEGFQWFNKEAYEELVWWSYAWQAVLLSTTLKDADATAQRLLAAYRVTRDLLAAEERSGYQMERLVG